MEIIESDVVIIGGGPAGCTCALYTSRSNLKTVILDKNPSVGALAITHQIANYPGVPVDISGEKLLTLMREQAVQYGTDYRRAQVFGIDASGECKMVYTPEGTFRRINHFPFSASIYSKHLCSSIVCAVLHSLFSH